MSITSDIRAYADSALEQGRHALGQAVGQAQSQFADVTGQVTTTAHGLVGRFTGTTRGNVAEFADRAADAVGDLRAQAEKTLNLDALVSAVEPYYAQYKQYRSTMTDRAEELLDLLRGDKRVSRVVATAETLTGVVLDTVGERVVKPVATLTGRAATAPRPATARPAATRPARKAAATAPAKKAPARSTARKAPARKAAARKAPAKKADS